MVYKIRGKKVTVNDDLLAEAGKKLLPTNAKGIERLILSDCSETVYEDGILRDVIYADAEKVFKEHTSEELSGIANNALEELLQF